jgi:pimeloyl-ACP methyl ester carboxylesterase
MVPSADGSLIAWAETGTGPPRMRAGHWLTNLQHDGSNAIWGPWIARLGQGRRLIRYDARGTGMSDTNCGELSLDSYVSDMRAVADAAGVETFDIFAASQSMAVTCAFAARYPDRVRRIVSYGGWPQGSRQRATYGSTGMTDAMGTMLRLGWAQPDSGYMKSFAALFMPDATPDQVDAFLRMQLASATPEQAVRIRDVLSRFDVTDVLPDVRAPVLVAHAKGDSLHPFSQARLLMRHLPDARLLALDGHNHILTPEEPAFAELMHAVDEFLR